MPRKRAAATRRRGLGRARLALSLCAASIAVAPDALALDVGFAIHAEGSAARMVGERKADQFGWGSGAMAGPELTLGERFGFELPLGVVILSDGDTDEPGLERTDGGFGFSALPGVRVRPFGRDLQGGAADPSGLWIAAGAGPVYTGQVARGGVDLRAGFDFLGAQAFRVGPTVGFMQVVEPNDSVRPEDARIVLFGIHAAFEPTPARKVVDDDRDDDGLRDSVDRCPDDPEDFDDWQDEDGCPEADNDGDGILDPSDACPNDPEDRDGFEDHDGCPDRDNDRDGLVDGDDGCPDAAEDIDGFEDADGCPDLDNDGDGIADLVDKCPLDPETFNGYADDDGCPDTDSVRVLGSEIILDERVYFHVNSADVQPRSWPLFGKVAELLKAHPQYTRVRVQGHADDTGTEDYNQALSVRRSKSVRDLLVRLGVERERLVVEGFGEERPSVDDNTEQARRKNRRVEFLILERTTVREREEVTPVTDLLPKGEDH